MRDQVCEWATLSDEAPRASKRKFQDLEQRSAGEHELLNHLRSLSEPDSLGLMRRLREGCSINDLLVSARELANTSPTTSSERALLTIRQPNIVHLSRETAPRADFDSGSDQNAGDILAATRPSLPPISSIWYQIPLYRRIIRV